jgi:hypothetical protein
MSTTWTGRCGCREWPIRPHTKTSVCGYCRQPVVDMRPEPSNPDCPHGFQWLDCILCEDPPERTLFERVTAWRERDWPDTPRRAGFFEALLWALVFLPFFGLLVFGLYCFYLILGGLS